MRNKIIFFVSITVFILLIFELLGYSAYYIILKKTYSKKEIKEQLRLNSGEPLAISSLKTDAGEIVWGDQVEVIHPYLGFTQDPETNIGVSSLGFPSFRKNQYEKREENKLIIAIMGGSFAREVYFLTMEKLTGLFSGYYNKNIVILNFAVGGYKQPQQLIALNYLLMSGAQFDIVLNIDGFNEAALPPVENVKYNVSPFYPRMWLNRVKNLYTPSEIRLIGKIESFKEFKKNSASFFYKNKLYRSPALSLAWKLIDRKFDSEIASFNMEMRKTLDHAKNFAATGPEYIWNNSNEKLYSDLADIWFHSSLLMNDICNSNGIKYYHILQPNQYLPDSKTLSPEELKNSYDLSHPYREPVIKGYPLLRQKGKELKEKKVCFLDLADIFVNNDQTLYKDSCCHLNQKGYEIFIYKAFEYIKASPESN